MDDPKTNSGLSTVSSNEPANNSPVRPASLAAQVEVDGRESTARYASFCRLSGTPEELLMDFGLNLHATGTTMQDIMMTQRVVTGWHTAKRLVQALQQTVERHEAVFGVLETDARKRVRRA